MKPYWSITSAAFRVLLQYRTAAAAAFGTRLFWGLIRLMIFGAFYRSTTQPQPLSEREMITYVWLGQGMLALILWGMDADVRQMVRTGTVAYELARPLDLYGLWFSRSLAARVVPTAMQGVPIFAVGWLFFGMQPPPSWAAGLGWGITTVASVLLACAMSTALSISLLWTVSGEGAARFFPALVYVLSGILVPLPLFPAWVQPLLYALPFRGLIDAPFRVYLGDIPPSGVPAVLAHQLLWTAALVLFGRWLLAQGMRRVVVQGG
jgi:ABC-2 type transport system permease protein